MTAGGPTASRIGNRQINQTLIVIGPRRTRDLFAPQEVMLNSGKNAAPVPTVERFVNHSLDFDVHAIAAEDAIVDSAQQIQQPALLSGCRVGSRLIAPCFRFILRHARSLIQGYRDVTDFATAIAARFINFPYRLQPQNAGRNGHG